MMFRKVTVALVLATMGVSAMASLAGAAEGTADRVVVMYFHRTQRCPTCMKMGSYAEEAVNSGFAEPLKAGRVSFHFIDFQDAKNAEFTQGYNIAGPALIVARVSGDKVAEYKNLKEIWAKVRDKDAFVQYVQDGVKGYLK
jgi:hypothetical protein